MLANYRIEVSSQFTDYRGMVLSKKLNGLGYAVDQIYVCDNYLINTALDDHEAGLLANALTQPVTQKFTINKFTDIEDFDWALEIGYLPGVTDNISHTVFEVMKDVLKKDVNSKNSVFSTISYFIKCRLSKKDIAAMSEELYNPLIQHCAIMTSSDYRGKGFSLELPLVELHEKNSADTIDINLPDNELVRLGKEGIKNADGSSRGPLALDIDQMHAIKNYFLKIEKRNPTDIELESIAQTWSEHCKHTIFAANIDGITDGFFKYFIKRATDEIRKAKGSKDFCLSVFSDNAGGIEFDDDYIVADKAETHNSPSALDPFGGSITGIVGVNRDLMGFGLGAKPIANRYGFCFGHEDDTKPLYRDKDEKTRLLSPKRIKDGVVHGVNVGGNCSGIPTPQGFVYYHDRYKGKPLVFVGTIGLIPKKINGVSSVEKKAESGDYIVIAGGRVGLDGIHGATFSSEALTSGSPATAVQIGDPITQKKMSDAIVKEARDRMLYTSITDNGAGGLSCSVAEMAKESGGFEVNMENIPLKYPGLSPWQIWISESQERMTFSVKENNLNELLALFKSRGVEAVAIGRFTASGRGIVKCGNDVVFNLDMDFLHNGLPQKVYKTNFIKIRYPKNKNTDITDYQQTIEKFIASPNIRSFEKISTQYDHEVQANSVVKPLQGKGKVNSNVSVIRPLLSSKKGVVISQSMYPLYSELDPYNMAACSIDTAIRNIISVGGTLDSLALLDNFCWCNSTDPERLGQLKEAVQACYNFAVKYGTPFVSGKDSMFNDFKGYDENFNPCAISIPPTLLISSIGVINNVETCQTIDFKGADHTIFLIGTTADELNGSEFYEFSNRISPESFSGGLVPKVDYDTNVKAYKSVTSAFAEHLISSSVSIERGGLLNAIMKSAVGGMMGADIDLSGAIISGINFDYELLFSETQGRFLVTVNDKNIHRFNEIMKGVPVGVIGKTRNDGKLIISGIKGSRIFSSNVDKMHNLYHF